MNIKAVLCPECGHRLKLGNQLHKGQRITCPGCESKLVVVNLEPIELDSAALVNRSTQAKKKAQVVEVSCPECDNLIKLNTHTREGYRILCKDCNTTLEVVNTNPLELDVALDIDVRLGHSRKFGKEK